jgi:hypothetical protein
MIAVFGRVRCRCAFAAGSLNHRKSPRVKAGVRVVIVLLVGSVGRIISFFGLSIGSLGAFVKIVVDVMIGESLDMCLGFKLEEMGSHRVVMLGLREHRA